MGLFAYTIAGGSLILIGGWESLVSDQHAAAASSSSSSSVSTKKKPLSSSSSVTFFAVTVLSFLFVLNSLISLIDAHNSKDSIGLVLQLEVIAIASLFLVYSIIGVLTHVKSWVFFPSSILNLLCLFGFIEEFMLFYLQRKDPTGIENQYYDLLLVPIGVCVVSTMLELKIPKVRYARFGRGIGLILQGTWLIQMGLSFFYSGVIAHGCSLHEKSRGNFTVKCKGHPEYHRGRAIATLQFNCHLAFLVVMVVGLYSFLCKKTGGGFDGGEYRQIGAENEMQAMDGGDGHRHQQFTLDSDDDHDKEDEIEEMRTEKKGEEQEVNSLDSH